ncbi:MAG: SDR family oxidoreductase [Acidimicrobiales bacterium]
MDLQLAGRTALVTGASSGLGLGCARALAAEGARVVLSSRSADKLAEAAAELTAELQAAADPRPAGEIVGTIAADVSIADEVARLCDEAEAILGPIDIVVANAGGPPPGTFASTDADAYPDALALNLLSTVWLCKRLVPGMQERKWGRVVAITSISVREPIGMLILSNTARAGLTGFLKTTATEVAADGVTVNSLQPGLHLTARLGGIYADHEALAETIPTKTLGDPDDFGRIAAFLCSDSAKFITGAAIPVDGGSAHGLQ